MAISRLTLVFFTVVSICYAFTDNPTVPPVFQVDLDLQPSARWAHIIQKYHQIVKDSHAVIRSKVPEKLIPIAEFIAADFDNLLEQPYADELRGIAITANMSLGDIVLTNLVYDISAFCTSITMQDAHGQIWHARNLDYGFTDILRNLTIRIDFMKNKKVSYSVVTYAGYVGVLTGQRPHAFAITLDERDQGAWYDNLLVALLERKVKPVSFLIRDTLAQAKDFTAALEMINSTVTAAEGYFIVSGTNKGEGAVITKNRVGANDIWRLDPSNGRWFEVETNYDHWTSPPASDNRRAPAIKSMNSMGQSNITVDSLFNVLSTPLVLNKKTTYSVVMSPAQPELMKVLVRHPATKN
ncbi:hypothetical protein SNE40_015060 [Patella caerulea]|uniref:N-acylethanolamine-hydrolyzing acid amidase n=1 Tax=Patella caerulea TaxID=87958 RepID=A0AAN8PIF4_PATCE